MKANKKSRVVVTLEMEESEALWLYYHLQIGVGDSFNEDKGDKKIRVKFLKALAALGKKFN